MTGTLSPTGTLSALQMGGKKQGQAAFREAVRRSWPGAVKQLKPTEAVESRREQMGPGMRGKQAGLHTKQNSHFPYLSFQGVMLAKKLLKNVWRQQPRGPPRIHTFFSQQLVVREKPRSRKTRQWCTHFPLREIKTKLIQVKLTQKRLKIFLPAGLHRKFSSWVTLTSADGGQRMHGDAENVMVGV